MTPKNGPVIEQRAKDALHGLENYACMLLAHGFAIWAAFAWFLLFRFQESFASRPRGHRTATPCEQTFLELGIESLELPRKLLGCFLRRFYDI